MGLVGLPTELLIAILDHLVPGNWNTSDDETACLELRLVCKRFDGIVSRHAFKKLDHGSYSRKYSRLNISTARWLLITKVIIENRVQSGLVADIRNAAQAIAVWKASSNPTITITRMEVYMEVYMEATCDMVIANRGQSWVRSWVRSWVCEQFKICSDNPSSPASLGTESVNHEVDELHTQRQANIEAMKHFSSLQVAAYFGDVSVVEILLQNGADPNAENEYLGHPLYVAAYAGRTDVVALLIERGADIHRSGDAGTPLEVAAYHGYVEIIQLLLDRGACLDDAHGKRTTRALLNASEQGHEKAVQLLLDPQYGLDVNARNLDNDTSLLLAIRSEHKEVVRMLLGCPDVQLDIEDYSGKTPLYHCVDLGWTDIVKVLVSVKNLDPNISWYRETPLMLAVERGHVEIVRLLITERDDIQPEFGDDWGCRCLVWAATRSDHATILGLFLEQNNLKPDDYYVYDSTMLLWAAEYGHESVVRLLLSRSDVDANFIDSRGYTALFAATRSCYSTIAQLLAVREDVDPNLAPPGCPSPLAQALLNGDETVARLLLERRDTDPNKGISGTPLLLAAMKGNIEIVQLLLERPDVNPNIFSEHEDDFHPFKEHHFVPATALWYATFEGYDRVVELLLSRADVNPNATLGREKTPLCVAAGEGHEALVRLFLARDDIDPNLGGIDGTPLFQAVRHGHDNIVRLLLERPDVDPNICSDIRGCVFNNVVSGGETPLCIASRKGRETTVKLLLDHHRIDPNMKGGDGRSPLLWATIEGHIAIVRLLLNHHATLPNLRSDEEVCTPLLVATNTGEAAIVELLLEHPFTDPNLANTDPKFANMNGVTPLLLATSNEDKIIVRHLLDYFDTDPNLANVQGLTPLLLAVERDYKGIVQCLLLHPMTNPSWRLNDEMETPLMLARKSGLDEMCRLLEEAENV